MDFLEGIAKKRQSCRSFDRNREVEPEKLMRCLEALRLAPSACNAQPYRVSVARGQAAARAGALTRGAGMNAFTADVPVLIVISEDSYNASALGGSKLKKQDYRSVDIGIAAAYFTAQALCEGLATCIIGWFDEQELMRLAGVNGRIRLVIAVGYARQDDPLRQKKRKDLSALVNDIEVE